MKRNILFSIVVLAIFSNSAAMAQKGIWITLFDGKSTENLRGYQMESFPNDAWKVEDGALVAQTDVPNIDLVTKKAYQNFELELDWKTSIAGNSGVFFYIDEVANKISGNGNSPNWLDNFEMQLLDDINFNDKEPKRSAGSLYDLITPQNKTLKPVGEYNTSKLIVKDNHVEHWLNGSKVVEYQIGSNELNELISKSKYGKNPRFAKSTSGLIMFQHHGQKFWLKNIRLREI